MRIAMLTPLPPVRSGIAGYAAMLLPEMARRATVTAVVEQGEWAAPDGVEVIPFSRFRRRDFDAVIGQLGNNPHHDFIYGEAMREPLHAVLHDFVLHHLIVERTLAAGDAAGYEAALRASHGEGGAGFARARAKGLHEELGNFFYPASVELARRSRGLLVHNRWAAERLRDEGVTTPIVLVEHPIEERPLRTGARYTVRARLGVRPGERVIGMFGFVTGAKRPQAVFEAFARARRSSAKLRLLIVGEPAPNVDLDALARKFDLPSGSWNATGFVDDAAFEDHLEAADRIVNLRYPTAGEMSGPLVRIFRLGRPVAVTAVAQFLEFPDTLVTRIPLGEGEVEALASFMGDDRLPDPSAAQQRWIAEHGSIAKSADAYLRALEGADDVPERPRVVPRSLPLLPRLSAGGFTATRLADRLSIRFTLSNEGDAVHRAAVYGEPALRIVAKGFAGAEERFNAWLAPGGDLVPGGRIAMAAELGAVSPVDRIELYAAISEVPYYPFPPFAVFPLGEPAVH